MKTFFSVLCRVTLFFVIQTFRHAGLREFWETGKSSKVNSQWTARLQVRLQALNSATIIEEIGIPGWRLHELKGRRAGTWAIQVTGNWRMTFRPQTSAGDGVESLDVYDVDLEDYHRK